MLPKVSYPTYEIKIPSTGKEITIRPFLVKEEKLLLMAIQSDEDLEIISTTKQVINNCILTEGIDVDKLPFFDVDYIFIALRAKSVGESLDIKFTCNMPDENGNSCNTVFDAKINITNVKLKEPQSSSLNISLSNGMTVKMKYPSYTMMKIINEDEDVMTKKIKLIASCIDMIVDGEQVHTIKDVTQNELAEFIESLTQQQFKKLEQFVDNLPSFVITTQATCSKCGFEHHLEYDDFTSFFV